MRTLVAFLAMLALGCKPDSYGSCADPSRSLCFDYVGANWAGPDEVGSQSCGRDGDRVYSTEPCTANGRVASCVLESQTPGESVTRYYAPITVQEAAASCALGNGGGFTPN